MKVLDIAQVRRETPACEEILHFNNAGASLSPLPVIEAIKQHIDLEASIGGYEAQALTQEKHEALYSLAGSLLNCSAEEIAFAENATRAWDMVFYSLDFKPGDSILTCVSEYASNYLAFLQMKQKTGINIVIIPDDENGQLDTNILAQKIDAKTKLIAITHIPTQGGLINPAIEVGKIAKASNILYLLDATQSIGQLPIDVQAIGCDFLCATGRKYLRGPRGTGFLYVRKDKISQCTPPFIDLYSAKWIIDNSYTWREDARRFETWEQNIAAKIGLAAALQYLLQLDIQLMWKRIQRLGALLREQLKEIS